MKTHNHRDVLTTSESSFIPANISQEMPTASQSTQITNITSTKTHKSYREKIIDIETTPTNSSNNIKILPSMVIKIPLNDPTSKQRYKKSRIFLKEKRNELRIPRFTIGAPMFGSPSDREVRQIVHQKPKMQIPSPEIQIRRSKSILKKRRTITLESNLSSRRKGESPLSRTVKFGSEAVPIVKVYPVKSYRNEYKEMEKEYEKERMNKEKTTTVCSGVCTIF